MDPISSAAFPAFSSVTVFALLVAPSVWLPKDKAEGDSVTIGTLFCAPVPESETICGLLEALSASVIVPSRLPTDVGLKVTEMLQLPPAGKLAGQMLVSLNSPLAV